MTLAEEPPDHTVYEQVSFNRDTFEFYLACVRFYQSILETDIKSVHEDEDLRAILGERALDSYPITRELRRVQRARQWIEKTIADGGKGADDYDVNISHGMVRLLKSVSLLYLEHLRARRQALASRPSTCKALIEAVDQQLARFEEKVGLGVFRNATPIPLMMSPLPLPVGAVPPAPVNRAVGAAPLPVVLESIEIRDPTLRKRCLDLLAQFAEDGQHDRLDTVVNEATRILEDRLRALASAPATCIGVDLAKYAFAQPSPAIVISEVASEQEAAHLLYRGVFGLVRNSVHHRLVGTLQPERVLQIVGMVDYLLSLAEAGRREKKPHGVSA